MRLMTFLPTAVVALAVNLCTAAPTDPVFTKESVLKAIVIFRDDPLSKEGRAAAALIIAFVDKSHDVVVSLNKKAFPVFDAPGVSQDEKALLLAAFAAGNADSQLLRGSRKDDPYAGDLQLIQTYRQLQKKDMKLKISSIEKMADMEQRGELKHYLGSK
jgi:hypothetical protein